MVVGSWAHMRCNALTFQQIRRTDVQNPSRTGQSSKTLSHRKSVRSKKTLAQGTDKVVEADGRGGFFFAGYGIPLRNRNR